MFESLKKKFSRTSEKLEEELIEEAEKEDNLQEESGQRFSFFSFGRKKEEEKEEEDDSNLLPEATEEAESEDVDIEEEVEEKKSGFFGFGKKSEDEKEDDEESLEEEEVEEKKSHFWSRSKDKSDEEDDEESLEEEEVEEKKSHFWRRNKDKSDEEDDEESLEEEEVEEKKSHFWSRNKDKKEDISADGEASGGIFSFVREKTISEKHVEDILWELEMELLQGDVAMEVATAVCESVKEDLVGKKIKRSNDITEYTYLALRNAVSDIIDIPGKSMTEMIEEKKAQGEPLVVMFVGINGTGKTTTIGKLANYYLKKGYTPVIAASDTFRAGAIEQVTYHADNVGVKIIKHKKGSDPAAVAYDAVEHAKAQGKELVLIDTAGRMQTNVNLMDEMKKIKRVANPDLVIFVGDALTGNDATEQASKFNEAIDIDGVILTKADADSKGGASLSIGYVIQRPIMFLGVGQGYDDIMEYDAEWMLDQLFSESEDEAEVLEE
ncbi:signal recognition particle-docking protein FtsY [Methanobrevibacter sp.]|uniref:signal recognition particle-docking protein FtsY n=1 Tax=Methanobrevibacter sp. TaxID=66852 RepID=UPI0025DAE27E|nr:signal recognition particle-docking protein FtsY [Methanobrevibacter sp.]MBQ6512228.1 signal recognition particle-docking protein FtsY [Methanobrevibacter sp.]